MTVGSELDRIICEIEEEITRLKFERDALKISRYYANNPKFANQANSIIDQILKKRNGNGGNNSDA